MPATGISDRAAEAMTGGKFMFILTVIEVHSYGPRTGHPSIWNARSKFLCF